MAVIAERLNTGQSWIQGRSACNSCSRELSALDLVPVFSWLCFKGRCRTCSALIPAAYAIGEATLGSLFVLAYLKLGLSLALIMILAAFAVLAFIVMYDLRHTVVPTTASTLLIVSSLGYALLTSGGNMHLGQTLLVAGVMGFLFFMVHFLSRGRAMGLGDSPVALALSLLTGGSLAIAGLLFSFWIGAVVGIAILVSRPKGHRMGIEVPFVPFLAAGYVLAYFTQWNPLLLTL
ncbi:MAG: leader peptidase (prepilin peptidase) / N-methyltransferase [Patescibacteria group bacterium]|nr:leader peptidase (prepilin peptidase) / N-methyltransferase [Patescibacteria group bacterium]